jgi:5-methylcytosine-specific restriction enzyme A
VSWRGDKRKTSERGYGWRWQCAREQYLRLHPLCVMCRAEGRTKAADVVDHRVPHRGDPALFWDVENWQSLCTTHHSGDKQAIERGGTARQEIGLDGWPVPAPTTDRCTDATLHGRHGVGV